MRIRVGTGLVVLALVATACANNSGDSVAPETTKAARVEAPEEPYTIEVRAQEAGVASLDIEGTANLPDGTLVGLSATRVFLLEGETDARGNNLATDTATVSGGEFNGSLTLDESFIDALVASGDTVSEIDGAVTVCATVRTGEGFDGDPNQPGEVSAVLGGQGEALKTSTQAREFGSMTENPSWMLEAMTSVELASTVSATESDSLEAFCV